MHKTQLRSLSRNSEGQFGLVSYKAKLYANENVKTLVHADTDFMNRSKSFLDMAP